MDNRRYDAVWEKINQTFNSYYYRMNYSEIEIEWMKEILRDKEEEIKKLEQENKKLKEELQRYKEMWDAGEDR